MTLALGDDSKQEVVTSQLIELDNSPTLTTTNVDLLTISSLDTPLSPSKVSLPISVTHSHSALRSFTHFLLLSLP